MGTWGSGNFESDSACDHRAELSQALIGRTLELLASEESWEADEDTYAELFVRLEWISALQQAGALDGFQLPNTNDLNELTTRWLAGWSDYFDGLSGPEFKAERRAVIDETFLQLRNICAHHETLRA